MRPIGEQTILVTGATDGIGRRMARDLARRILADHGRLDALVNNAGIGSGPRDDRARALNRDGHELRFAVNYLAPFLLTRTLLPLLEASAPSRIVDVASVGQAPIDFDDVMLERGYDGMRAYAQSKLALIVLTLTRRRADRRGSGRVDGLRHKALREFSPLCTIVHLYGNCVRAMPMCRPRPGCPHVADQATPTCLPMTFGGL